MKKTSNSKALPGQLGKVHIFVLNKNNLTYVMPK